MTTMNAVNKTLGNISLTQTHRRKISVITDFITTITKIRYQCICHTNTTTTVRKDNTELLVFDCNRIIASSISACQSDIDKQR